MEEGSTLTPNPGAVSGAAPRAPELSLPPDYVPGDVVAQKYQLKRRIGQGGMGAVWIAHHRARLPPHEAVRLILPIIAATQAAHEGGVIHRDLKPENIFITPGDRGVRVPKVVDFGIAKLRDQASGAPRNLTIAGTIVGSPD